VSQSENLLQNSEYGELPDSSKTVKSVRTAVKTAKTVSFQILPKTVTTAVKIANTVLCSQSLCGTGGREEQTLRPSL
jgi:hypothetical protein